MASFIENIDLENLAEKAGGYAVIYGTKLIGAIIVLVLGLWVIKAAVKATGAVMEKKSLDASLTSFIKSFLNMALKAMLFISVLTMVGVEMTSFVALIGAAGLAVGMALSGTLQNFAGGVMILLFKPFKVGDAITAQGYTGAVDAIKIFNTILKTPDNKVIILPNGSLSTSSMVNITDQDTRRVDWTFGIGYGDDYDKAKAVLLKLIEQDERIHNDPEPFIALHSLGDSAVNIVVRVWCNKEDYWSILFDMNEKVYKTFPAEGLNIPYPQMDVHVIKE